MKLRSMMRGLIAGSLVPRIMCGLCILSALAALSQFALYHFVGSRAKGMFVSRHRELTVRVERRMAQEPGDLTVVHVWGTIAQEKRATAPVPLIIWESKGDQISDRLCIPPGSTDVHEFEIAVGESFGAVVDAWLANVVPTDSLPVFEQLHVYPSSTNSLKVVVQAKPGAVESLDFRLAVLRYRIDL